MQESKTNGGTFMDENTREITYNAKEIIKMIRSSGGDAYIIGESAYNIIYKKPLDVVNIYTNLSETNIMKLFREYYINKVSNNIFSLKYLGYDYIITLPVAGIKKDYKKKKISKEILSDKTISVNLVKVLEREKYTIHALALNKNNKVIDIYGGQKDHKNKVIRSVYAKPKQLFDSNPIVILELMNIISQTGFSLESRIIRAIKKTRKLLSLLPIEEISPIMKKIYDGKYFKRAINMMIKTKTNQYLPLFKDAIIIASSSFFKVPLYLFLGLGMIKEEYYDKIIGVLTDNPNDFMMFVNLAITNTKPDYDKLTLFSFGLEKCLLANRVNSILGKAKRKYFRIKKAYRRLPIKKTCDLAFKGQDILDLAEGMSTDEINLILDEVIEKILDERLINDYDSIRTFIIGRIDTSKFKYDDKIDKDKGEYNG